MTSWRKLRAVACALALLAPAVGGATPGPREAFVSSAHIRVGDCVPGAPAEIAAITVTTSPSVGASRLVQREEIAQALRAHALPVPAGLPETVRVVRKGRRLDVDQLAQLVRGALTPTLPRGITLGAVRPAGTVDVPDGWSRVEAVVPRPPHRTGTVSSVASVTLFEGDEATWMLSVPVEMTLSREAAVYDVTHGAPVLLTLRRGLVEVSVRGTAGADGDVGGVIPILLYPSGRVLSARLDDKEHASAVELP